jgi:hypothetical protein
MGFAVEGIFAATTIKFRATGIRTILGGIKTSIINKELLSAKLA